MQQEFKATFKELEYIALPHSYAEAFRGFLVILLNFLADGQYQKQRDETLAKFSQAEKQQFNKVFYAFFDAQKRFWEFGNASGWLDVLGEFYEEINSRSKSSAMGQFFTPPSVCDIMAQITIAAPEETDAPPKVERCADPCSGSGRLILAAHAVNPYVEFTAVDKDYMCALMTAINMHLNGCTGVVYWGDSLSVKAWEAFKIAPHFLFKVPVVMPYQPSKEEFKAVCLGISQQQAKAPEPPPAVVPPMPVLPDMPPPKVEKAQQLLLF